MKRNPSIGSDSLLKIARRVSVKKNFAITFTIFLFLGLILLHIQTVPLLKISFISILFISSLFMCSVSLQQAYAVGIFEMVRFLPIKIESIIPFIFLIDSIAIMGIATPFLLFLLSLNNFEAIIFLFWLIFAVLLGQTIGLAFVATLGVKKKFEHPKSIFVVLMLFLVVIFISMAVNSEVLSQFVSYAKKYCFLFPFTVFCNNYESFLLLILYFSSLLPINHWVTKKAVSAILNPLNNEISKKRFQSSKGGKIMTLVLKDFKIAYRNPSGLIGIVTPIVIALPQLLFFSKESDPFYGILTISFLSPLILGLLIRAEGQSIDFLRTLPVSKFEFALSKAIATAAITTGVSIALVTISLFFNGFTFSILIAVSLPICFSLLGVSYLFRYKSEEPGIPSTALFRMLLLFVIQTAVLVFSLLPIYALPSPVGYIATFLLLLAISVLLIRRMKN
ncbi:MAG: hypothetical protein QXK70_00440 [Archaeoglobaceae archaeon]